MKGTTKKNFGKSGRSGAVLTLAGLFIMAMALVFGFAGCGDGAGGGDDNGGGTSGGTDTANHGFTNIANVYASWSSGSYQGAIEVDGTNFKKWGLGTHYDETPDYEGTYTISGSEITLNITKFLGYSSSLGAKRYSYSSADANTVTIGVSELPTTSTSTYTYTKVSAATGSGLHVKAVESSSKATATLGILTEKAATGLTAADISLSNDFTSTILVKALSAPAKGDLTEVAGSGGHAWRLGVTPHRHGVHQGWRCQRQCYNYRGKRGYLQARRRGSLSCDVSSGKTKLEFEFFKGVEGLTVADFTIVSGATKGSTVTDATTSHKNWALDSSGATSPIKVKITKSGVDPAEHTVTF
ncbi:MAG: hypothetical protein MdMp014T_0673 [Treponematales bacterium]